MVSFRDYDGRWDDNDGEGYEIEIPTAPVPPSEVVSEEEIAPGVDCKILKQTRFMSAEVRLWPPKVNGGEGTEGEAGRILSVLGTRSLALWDMWRRTWT